MRRDGDTKGVEPLSDRDDIVVVNASENNLKGVSVRIPKKRLSVVTGISGSGKSSLVFDTIAAESRRELNETFPSFVQHYLPKYGRPQVDIIRNLPVTIVLDQKKLSDNARSTVGTYTDVFTFLRLLFSRVGKPFVGYSDGFSFNHPEGKCPACDGLGVRTELLLDKLIDFDKSLNEGAIDFPTFQTGYWRWIRYAYSGYFDLDKKIRDYSREELEMFLHSPQIKPKNPLPRWPKTALYEGIVPRFYRSIIGRDEGKRRGKRMRKIVTTGECSECGGSRLNERVRSCRINGMSIADVSKLPLEDLLAFVLGVEDPLAVDIRREVEKRLRAMLDIGLGYLTLSRGTGTLSGGEAQRIKIAKHINGSLADIVYVLDEPSAGLHPHDIGRLKGAILRLLEQGNTVLMVEHHPDLIRMADHIVDMGPEAGEGGGEILYAGPFEGFADAGTATSRDLAEGVAIKAELRRPHGWIEVAGEHYHNLGDLRVRIPLGVLAAICGVAGSGKSSLGEVAQRYFSQDVVAISQKNIGISLRSTPATYMDVGDEIRKLFARENRVAESYFSFNSKGACPCCKGRGVIITNMAFMEDIVSTCEVCNGTRYNEKTLSYRCRGKNVAEVMGMTVLQALDFFADRPFAHLLRRMERVGLGYLRLDQSLSTLSGGELQRLKLASHLDARGTVYILDEPTAGLHMEDVKKLLSLFDALVDEGNSVIVMEHNLAVIKRADWLIELGPEGGNKGGRLIYAGTPEGMRAAPESVTGRYL